MADLTALTFKIAANGGEAISQLKSLSKAMGSVKAAAGAANPALGAAIAGMKGIKGAASTAGKSLGALKGTIGSLRTATVAFIAVIYKLGRALSSCIKSSMDFVETMNLFNVSMGDNAIKAGQFAEKVQQAFGIDMADWMRNQGVFQTLIEGFGVASEKADIMSQNLTQLGYDLSSLFNLPFAESMQKLQSGIAGELEPLRRLGYDLSQAKLQQIAYEHGIQQTVSTMTQAEKSQLRYYAIMTQVTTAQGDMARTITQPANMLRVLKQNVVIAGRSIGNLLIPIMQKFIGVAIIVARGIAKVATAIAKFFGINTDWSQYLDTKNYGTGIEDLGDTIEDVGGKTGKATKKVKEFKKQFLGFDKINNITLPDPTTGTSGGGGGGGNVGGGDFDLPLPEYDFLQGIEDAFAKSHPKLQKLFNDLAKDFEKGGKNIGKIMGRALRDALVSINWDKVKKAGKKVGARIAGGLNDFIETPGLFKAVGKTVAESLNTVFGSANTFAKTFKWAKLGKEVASSINEFFSSFDFKAAGETLSNLAKGLLNFFIGAVKKIDWGQMGKKCAEFIAGIDWLGLIEKAIELAGLVIEGIAKFAIEFIKSLTVSILEWLYDVIVKKNEATMKLNMNGKENPSAKKVIKDYSDTKPKDVVVNTFGREDSSFVTQKKDFQDVKDKDATVTLDAKQSPKYKENSTDWKGLKDKTAIKTLNAKKGEGFDDKVKAYKGVKSETATLNLKGNKTKSYTKAVDSLNKNTKTTTATLKVVSTLDKNTKVLSDLMNKNAEKTFRLRATGDMMTMVPMTKALGGLFRNGKWRPVTAAAGGGSFNTGQMFIAREAGPELVGRIGNSTAVMNNDQIVASVAAGVASANSAQNSLLRQLINAVQGGGNSQVVLQVDSTKLGEVSIRSINKVQRQQGRVLLQV